MTTLRKPMTEIERRLFKEAIIREYQLKHEKQPKEILSNKLLKRLKTLMPIDIAIGCAAVVLFVYLNGFRSVINLLLMGIIWLTLISALVSIFVKTK